MLRRSDCMKILYIAQEHCAAQVAARALSRIAPNVRLSWASSPEAAIGWIRDNRDAQAVIAETGREDPAFDALLEQVRGIGVTTPIAAVAPEHLDALSAALEANLEVLATEERQRVLQDQERARRSPGTHQPSLHRPPGAALRARSGASRGRRASGRAGGGDRATGTSRGGTVCGRGRGNGASRLSRAASRRCADRPRGRQPDARRGGRLPDHAPRRARGAA